MDAWSREESIALVSLAVALLAAVAGALALSHARAKLVLLALLAITALGSFAFLRRGAFAGPAFTEEDVKREREAIEKARSAAAAREALAQLDREARARQVADSLIRDSIRKADAERHAREQIAWEREVAAARLRIERETRARDTETTAELLVGRWTYAGSTLGFSRDGRLEKRGIDSRYRVVGPDSLVEETWCCTWGTKILALSADSLVIVQSGMGADMVWRREH